MWQIRALLGMAVNKVVESEVELREERKRIVVRDTVYSGGGGLTVLSWDAHPPPIVVVSSRMQTRLPRRRIPSPPALLSFVTEVLHSGFLSLSLF